MDSQLPTHFSGWVVDEKFPDISIKTIENVLSTFLNEGKIIKIGSYKDARFKAK